MIDARPSRSLPLAAAACLLLGAAGCTSTSDGAPSSSGPSTSGLSSFFSGFGGDTPLPRPTGTMEYLDCPPVTVIPGRSAIRNGDGTGLRSQISIVNVARECLERPDRAVTVKVGIEGRALLGPAGGNSGRFDVPVSFQLKRGDAVLASRQTRTSVSVPAGQGYANFIVVQGDMVVPAGTGEFEIEVGLGTAATARQEQIIRERRSLVDRPPPTPKAR